MIRERRAKGVASGLLLSRMGKARRRDVWESSGSAAVVFGSKSLLAKRFCAGDERARPNGSAFCFMVLMAKEIARAQRVYLGDKTDLSPINLRWV
jgi:hypothetical protein